jgi:hypothetical protein
LKKTAPDRGLFLLDEKEKSRTHLIIPAAPAGGAGFGCPFIIEVEDGWDYCWKFNDISDKINKKE